MIGKIILLVVNLIGIIIGSIEFYKYKKEVDSWKERPPINAREYALMWGWLSGMLMMISSGGTLMTIFLIIFESV